MKKSIMMAMVVFLVMVASLAYAEVQIVNSTSTSYNEGLVAAQLYLNDSNVWVQQVKLYNGTAFPGYDHPCYILASSMTYANTVASSNSRVRYPSVPYVFPANISSAAIKYYLFGDADVLAVAKSVLTSAGVQAYYSETGSQMVQTAIGVVNAVVAYSVSSGGIIYFPVEDQTGKNILNTARMKAILAADSFIF